MNKKILCIGYIVAIALLFIGKYLGISVIWLRSIFIGFVSIFTALYYSQNKNN